MRSPGTIAARLSRRSVAPLGSDDVRHGRAARRTALLIAVAAIALPACSGSDSSGPPIDDDVATLQLGAVSTWGSGRALRAVVSDDVSVLAVASTTGVVTLDPAGSEPVRLATFGVAPGSLALAITPDGASVFVATSEPPLLTRYDSATADVLASAPLPPTAAPIALTILPGAEQVLVETADGPLRWTAGDPAVTALLPPGQAAGRSAVDPSGTIVTPIAGTNQLVRAAAPTTATVAVPLSEGETFGDAATTPSSGLVALTAGTGADAFERVDDVVVLDDAGRQVVSRVTSGLALRPGAWAVTDDAVAVADAGTVVVRGFDGRELATIPSPSGAGVDQLLGTTQGVVAVYADGVVVLHRSGSWAAVPIRIPVGRVVDVALTPSTDVLVGVDVYGEVTIWNVADGVPLHTVDRFRSGELTGVDIDPTGERLAVTGTDGTVTILDRTLAPQATLTVDGAPLRVDSVRFDPVAGGVVAGNAERLGPEAFDDTLTMWDIATGEVRFSVGGEAEDVGGCSFFLHRTAFTSDGAVLVSASHDFSVEVLEPGDGRVIHRLAPRTGAILDLAFTPDDELLVVTADDSRVEVWSTADWSLAAAYDAPMGGYFAVAPLDADTYVAVDITGAISLVDVMSGDVVGTIPGPGQRVSTIATSPDGRLIAAPGIDGSVSVWGASGRLLAEVGGHTAPVTDLAFAPDSASIATVSSDGTAMLHELALTSG